MPQNFFELVTAFDEEDGELGTPLNVALQKWNNGIFPDDIGVHEDVPIYDKLNVRVDNGYG
jgi:hypothetical protein